MNIEQNIMTKNTLDVIVTKLNKISEINNELKHILNDSVNFNGQILKEDLFWDISQDIIDLQIEINSFLKNIS